MFSFNKRLAILMYHRVLARAEPLRPWDVDTRAFDWQMRLLARYFNVLPLPEATRRVQDGSLPARAVSITFDDGYADNLLLALPILKKYQLHATFFIASGFLDGGRMWNDTVIETFARASGTHLSLTSLGLGRYPLDNMMQRFAGVKEVLGKVKYRSTQERVALTDAMAALVAQELPRDLMLTTAQLRALHAAGMEIGAHTVNHPILARTTPQEAEYEIVQSRRRLQELLDDPIATFAYPNGRPGTDYATAHVAMVRNAGFDGAVSTAWGAARRGMNRFQLARIAPWDVTPARFGLRIARSYFGAAPALLDEGA